MEWTFLPWQEGVKEVIPLGKYSDQWPQLSPSYIQAVCHVFYFGGGGDQIFFGGWGKIFNCTHFECKTGLFYAILYGGKVNFFDLLIFLNFFIDTQIKICVVKKTKKQKTCICFKQHKNKYLAFSVF